MKECFRVAYLSKRNVQDRCEEGKEGFQGKDSFWNGCLNTVLDMGK